MQPSLFPATFLAFLSLCLLGCTESESLHAEERHGEGLNESAHHEGNEHAEGAHEEHQKITVTSPLAKDVISTQQYVSQIRSCRHIEVRALEGGYLEEIMVKEGQAINQGDLMFKIVPTLYQAELESDIAEAQLVQIEYNNTQRLVQQNVVSPQELAMAKAKLDKALATVKLSRAKLDFANIKAPFDGIIDRLYEQQGSLIDEGDNLTTLSDNSTMWVYFNVPEARYLEYKAALDEGTSDEVNLELRLANGATFPQPGVIGAIEADFNNETGNIAFRADFENPHRLLRHGQTGTILIHRVLKGVTVIPQRATFETLDKRYAYVVGDDGVAHQRLITVESELDDIFVIKDGLKPGEKIILEGIRQVRDGDKLEYEFRDPVEVLGHLKNKAE